MVSQGCYVNKWCFIYTYLPATLQKSMDSFEEMTEPPSLPHGGKSRLSSHSDDSGCDLMDDSLTDMQWLPGMDAGGKIIVKVTTTYILLKKYQFKYTVLETISPEFLYMVAILPAGSKGNG